MGGYLLNIFKKKFFSNLDRIDELMYGNANVSLNSLAQSQQQFNMKKLPIKFSPLKLQKPNKKVVFLVLPKM